MSPRTAIHHPSAPSKQASASIIALYDSANPLMSLSVSIKRLAENQVILHPNKWQTFSSGPL